MLQNGNNSVSQQLAQLGQRYRFCQLTQLLSRLVSVKRENVKLLETNAQINQQQRNNRQCMILALQDSMSISPPSTALVQGFNTSAFWEDISCTKQRNCRQHLQVTKSAVLSETQSSKRHSRDEDHIFSSAFIQFSHFNRRRCSHADIILIFYFLHRKNY